MPLQPQDYSFIPESIDQMFNNFLQLSLAAKQERARRGKEIAEKGFDPVELSQNPEVLQRVQQASERSGIRIGQSPDGLGGLEEAASRYMANKKQERELGIQSAQADIRSKKATAALNETFANLYGAGGGGKPNVVNIGGVEHIQIPTRSGPKFQKVGETTEERELGKQKVKARTAYADAVAAETERAPLLDELLEKNKKTLGGVAERALLRGARVGIGNESETYRATIEIQSQLKKFVVEVLKSSFGGQLSEGEREYMNYVQGAADGMTRQEREVAIQRIKKDLRNAVLRTKTKYKTLSGEGSGDASGGGDPLGIL